MNITEKLDLAIKLNEKGSTDGEYLITYKGKTLQKQTYMTNEEWDAFVLAMKSNEFQPSAYEEYSEGGGDELSEKNGRPPKMASYGSSSRMIYMLSAHKEGFHYERKLPTTVGGKANLDGFYEDETRYIFVEAKCHEPYSNKANTVSECYRELYEYLTSHTWGSINIEMKPCDRERYMTAEFFADGEALEHFDIKQMICHLLGIATGLLTGTVKQKQIDFIYLLYDSTELDIEPDAKEAVDRIYERTCYECNLIDFAELFRAILAFLNETKFNGAMTSDELDRAVINFTFTLATQDFYPLLLQ
ncbi:MAG: hypothetical protein IJ345_03705 [Clostridia bacterium]|nr:hypothetical protein [Clostridia bacterium]